MKPIVKKTAEDLEREKKFQRRQTFTRIGLAVYIVACLGIMFGGMFAGITWLVITGLVVLFGGAFVFSIVVLAVSAIKSGIKSYKKYGGSKTAYILKAVVCITLAVIGALFIVLGCVLDVLYLFGAMGAFGVMIVIFFGWQP